MTQNSKCEISTVVFLKLMWHPDERCKDLKIK